MGVLYLSDLARFISLGEKDRKGPKREDLETFMQYYALPKIKCLSGKHKKKAPQN